jgi:hypothetical protein
MNEIKKISFWIDYRYSSSLMLILFFVVLGFFWVFNFSPFPISNPEFIKLSGQEGLLDTMLFYSSQEAFAAMGHYGEEGRNLYMVFLSADFIFIIFYSFAFSFLMTVTVRSVCGHGSLWLTLNLLPLGIGFLDCVENICILMMLRIYPSNNAVLGTISGYVTLSKWLLTVAVISCLIYGGVILLLRHFGFKKCTVQR